MQSPPKKKDPWEIENFITKKFPNLGSRLMAKH